MPDSGNPSCHAFDDKRPHPVPDGPRSLRRALRLLGSGLRRERHSSRHDADGLGRHGCPSAGDGSHRDGTRGRVDGQRRPASADSRPHLSIAKTKTDPGWVSCHATFAAKRKEVAADVEAMAKLCAATTKMKPMGKPVSGKQADQDVAQSFPLAARSGHCYRAYAQGSDGIQDLDLVIKDSAGIIVGQDSTDDASPVVTEDGAVCFQKDDAATVVISVGMGKGTYAIQVWSD